MQRFFPLALAGAIGALATAAQASTFTFYTSQSAFDAASTTAIVEDFEGVAAGDLNTPLASFSRNGITYTPFAGAPFANVWIAGAPVDYTNFGADIPVVGGTQLTSHVMVANGDEDIRADFSAGYTAIGFDAYYNGLGPFTLSVLGLGGVTLATFGTADGTDAATGLADRGYIGVVSDTPLWGFRWTTTHGAVLNTGFDNIALGRGVPEPAAWALMIAGFGLAGATLRRRRTLTA
jgi:hypothetical protein